MAFLQLQQPLPIDNIVNHTQSIKLDGKNYWMWRSAVLPIIRAYDSQGFILGTQPCPPQHLPEQPTSSSANSSSSPADKGPVAPEGVNLRYMAWQRQDQLLLSWLLSTIKEEVFIVAVGINTSRVLWTSLEGMFSKFSTAWMTILQNQIGPLANDKFNINSQNEPLQAKNVTSEQADLNNNVDDGEADLNNNVDDVEADLNNNVGTRQADPKPFQWALALQRNSYALCVGQQPMLTYFATAENESIGRERFKFMQNMLAPCQLPPQRDDDLEPNH